MKVTGLNIDQVRTAVDQANKIYAGNVVLQDWSQVSKNVVRVKFGTLDSSAGGSRTSASGRKGKYLCWHGFRDVISGMFDINPDAKVVTGLKNTVYKGRDGFEDVYPDTAYENIGSDWYPAYMPELCNCNG